MKKLLLSLLLVGLISGCSTVGINLDGKATSTEEIITPIQTILVPGKIVSANKATFNGKQLTEDISKRTASSENYCNGNTCYLKQYLGERYIKIGKDWKELVATTSKIGEQMLGDTASSTMSNTTMIICWGAGTNCSGSGDMSFYGTGIYSYGSTYWDGTETDRTIVMGALPAGSGTISAVNLYMYQVSTRAQLGTVNVQSLSRTNWVDTQATWNSYKTGSAWTTKGGDFSATIIHHLAISADNKWQVFILMGAGADNPLTLTWGDTVSVILKLAESGGGVQGNAWLLKDYTTESLRPYFLITYSATAPASVRQQIIITE